MRPRTGFAAVLAVLSAAGLIAATTTSGASAAPGPAESFRHDSAIVPGDLLVSESFYRNDPGLIAGTTLLPPGSASGAPAVAGGKYPFVFNNDTVDGSFGVVSPLVLREISPDGRPVSTIRVPSEFLNTSFSSKSEGALNLSTDGKHVTFIDYAAAPDTIDASNANTPSVIDPTNPVSGAYYRSVARLDESGKFTFTETNAYSGNNGRAAIAAEVGGKEYYYTAGNAGNGATPQPDGVILGAGAQIITPSAQDEFDQAPPVTPSPVGSFSISKLGDKPDKVGKDDNFRGLTIFNNVLYYTKGSGGNGVDTVYFLDTTGTACPGGTGVPAAGATLPTTGLSYDVATLQQDGLPSNMCVLRGFPTALAKNANDATNYPFGIWFANADTLYVADEGSGDNAFSAATGSYPAAAASTSAGLQKWVFDSAAGQWKLAYTLQGGLRLGEPYSVAGYPSGVNSATGLPWSPATDGLRNITGKVNRDGTVTIWAVTSTVSGGGDQGADPNQLVSVTDRLRAVTQPAHETFRTVIAPAFDKVVRGVSFTPGTPAGDRKVSGPTPLPGLAARVAVAVLRAGRLGGVA
jgi:hypothetical protein